MSRKLLCYLAILLVGATLAPSAFADSTVGYLLFTPNAPGAEFDILNITGVNSADGLSPDANYVTSSVDLSSLNLVVSFATGPDETFGSSYFTLNSLDGISWDGTAEANFVGTDPAVSATLTGDFVETTFTLSDSSTVTVNPGFSATISDATGLTDADFAYIVATTGSSGPPPPTPEPEPLIMVGTGLIALAGYRRQFLLAAVRRFSAGLFGAGVLLAFAGAFLLIPIGAQAQVKLATSASPSTGVAGYNSSTLTGSGFPAGTINPSTVTLTFSATCGGAAAATENPTSVSKFVLTTDHVAFPIPASLSTGTYYVSLAGSSPSFSSSNCSQINVTATSTTLASCVPTSSLAVAVGTNVNAYVPFGYWEDSTTGIEEVPLEGSGTAQNFATPGSVNSCAANSTTGEIVCTENTANVDLINGSTLTTITSGANQYASFTGGSCYNCGVGVNASNNTAVIAMGISGGNSGQGVQVLNLSNNTFDTPFPMNADVSEDISIDSGRNLILSPAEDSSYQLLQIGAGNALTEYDNYLSGSYDGDLDSAAEDCTTGIALSADEFSDDIYITDLTQATFTSGTPGTWTAPGQFINLNDGGYSAGTSGISSAPGTNHLGVVTGEFGGSSYAALQLPSTSGSGTPTLADYAYVGSMPSTPDGYGFSAGFDPHTVTAYTSPNNGKSYAVFADYAGGDTPTWLGVVDLSCVLALPRDAGTHNVTGDTSSCTRYVAIP